MDEDETTKYGEHRKKEQKDLQILPRKTLKNERLFQIAKMDLNRKIG